MKRVILILTFLFISLTFAGCQRALIEPVSQSSLVAASDFNCQIYLSDDQVIAENNAMNLDFSGWQGIKSVTAGVFGFGGIYDDGTVVTIGYSPFFDKFNTDSWNDICMLEFTLSSVYGLQKDGTLVYSPVNGTGIDNSINEKVAQWKDINYIDTGFFGIVGVQKNGEVKAALNNFTDLEDKVSSWADIRMASISAIGLRSRIIGLKTNGEIVEAQSDQLYQYNLDSSKDLFGAEKICAGDLFTAGLMPDGTLRVVCGKDYDLQIKSRQEGVEYIDVKALDNVKDVQDINSYEDILIVLLKDGTVLAAGVGGD